MTCRRRASDSIERRFCFDITVGTSEKNQQMTLQALSDDDLQAWLLAMDGKEPVTSLSPHCCHVIITAFVIAVFRFTVSRRNAPNTTVS